MPNWPAMLLAPFVALANQSIIYAMVSPACAHQHIWPAHAVSALSLLACIWMSRGAWRNWRGMGTGGWLQSSGSAARDRVVDRPPFIALVAALVGALSALSVAALWFPIWVLSPCAG
jgi:hypothetical protein